MAKEAGALAPRQLRLLQGAARSSTTLTYPPRQVQLLQQKPRRPAREQKALWQRGGSRPGGCRQQSDVGSALPARVWPPASRPVSGGTSGRLGRGENRTGLQQQQRNEHSTVRRSEQYWKGQQWARAHSRDGSSTVFQMAATLTWGTNTYRHQHPVGS